MRVDGASGPASRPGQGHPPPRWGDSWGRGGGGEGMQLPRRGLGGGGGGVGWVWAGFARPDSLQRAPQGMSTHHRLPPPHPPTLAQPLAPHVLGGRSCRRSPRAAGQAVRRCVFWGGGVRLGRGGRCWCGRRSATTQLHYALGQPRGSGRAGLKGHALVAATASRLGPARGRGRNGTASGGRTWRSIRACPRAEPGRPAGGRGRAHRLVPPYANKFGSGRPLDTQVSFNFPASDSQRGCCAPSPAHRPSAEGRLRRPSGPGSLSLKPNTKGPDSYSDSFSQTLTWSKFIAVIQRLRPRRGAATPAPRPGLTDLIQCLMSVCSVNVV